MPAILPGRPQSKRQAVSTAHWDGLRLVAYISGNAAIISRGPQEIIQTIYVDNVESLTAIAIEESNGRVAVCDERHVYIYEPVGRDEGTLRWVQAQELIDEQTFTVSSLSWGSAEELLIGGTRLLLWFIPDSGTKQLIWDQQLAYPVALAYVTYDGGLIASFGQHDRLVKVWRRLSYEVDSTRFDVSYLPHPAAVTNVHWRKPWHAEQNLDSLLYTFCADNQVRAWAYSDPHSRSVMQHITTVDMNISIQPRRLSIGSMSQRRYAFIVDSRDFSSATENAVQSNNSNGTNHALEHLIEIANRSPEICIVLDGIGHMSVWGLENAGCNSKLATELFNVAHVDGMNVTFNLQNTPLEDYIHFCVFAGGRKKSSISLLVHSFAGDISWYECSITKLFDTSSRHDRAELISLWAGHDGPVEKLVSDDSGRNIMSWTSDGDGIVWTYQPNAKENPLARLSILEGPENVIDVKFLADSQFAVLLTEESVTLWDIRKSRSELIASVDLIKDREPFAVEELTSLERGLSSVMILYSDGSSEVYSVQVPSIPDRPHRANGARLPLKLVEKAGLSILEKDGFLSLCSHTKVGFLVNEDSIISQRSAVSLSRSGILRVLTCTSNQNGTSPEFYQSSKFDTNIRMPVLIAANPIGYMAVVDRSQNHLVIWNFRTGGIEFVKDFSKGEIIERLDWMTTVNEHSILVVCFSHSIIIFAPSRIGRSNTIESWIRLQQIRMRDFTSHAIGSICCLNNADIVVGAGNQLVVLEIEIDTSNDFSKSIRGLPKASEGFRAIPATEILNANLPIFDPELLSCLTQLGCFQMVKSILSVLHEKLKYFSEGESLQSSLGFEVEDLTPSKRRGSRGDATETGSAGMNPNGTPNGFEESDFLHDELAEQVRSRLTKYQLWQLSAQKQTQLKDDIDVYVELRKHVKSVDENALRYLHALHSSRQNPLPWSAIVFASLSTSQEVLVDHVTRMYGGKLTWDAARKTGMFLWLSDTDALRLQLENVGRAEYTKGEDRNPVDCSLFYLALGKKNVLQGLWRMTIGVREKENTMKLLANNFKDKKWKATALKNAYALLSKRRFHYGAAFFLLGGNPKDAVNVCAHQIKDIQLAIAIARVSEKENESVFRDLLEQTVLNSAIESVEGRWMASWAYTMLGQPQQAIQVLVRPVHQVIGKSIFEMNGMVGSLNILANDPILSVLYQQLRSRLTKQNEWRGIVTPREEWDFVMRCVRYWRRMGCDNLALALVREWEFIPGSKVPSTTRSFGNQSDVEKSTEENVNGNNTSPKADQKKKKAAPTQFEEPSANSLLDSFGF